MLIQGDNLDALKALLPFYAGRVKCIYIDPPYNTRSAFEHYDDNLEHSQWLAMIWPRLELLRELLAEDGSIWVSIDDHEGHYLKVVMDEVFGRSNFIDTIIWRKNYSPKSSARHFSSDYDYVLVFGKNADRFRPNLMPRTDRQNKAYRNPDDDPRGPWKTSDLSARNPTALGSTPSRPQADVRSKGLRVATIGACLKRGSGNSMPTIVFGGGRTETPFHKSRGFYRK